MTRSHTFKTAAIALVAALTISTSVHADEVTLASYVDSLVSEQVHHTKTDIENQSKEAVLTTSHRFTLDETMPQEMVAKVTVTFLDSAASCNSVVVCDSATTISDDLSASMIVRTCAHSSRGPTSARRAGPLR